MALARAIAAADGRDWPACLEALLEAWREVRDDQLAALIDRVTIKAPGDPVGGSGSATANVKKRIAAATVVDVAPILEFALRQVRTFPRAYKFVVELAGACPPDPRIATALVALIDKPAFAGMEGAFQQDVVAALDAIDDPRYRALLVDRWRALEPNRGRIRKYRPALDVLKRIAIAIETREAPGELAGLAAAIASIDGALAGTPKQRTQTHTSGELLAAIYDEPGDRSLRLIYADALQESGDPRGELIALQCARGTAPPCKRERTLLELHGRVWLGAIEPMVQKQGVVFRAGFVACARQKRTGNIGVSAVPNLGNAPVDAPEWTTVEELEITLWGEWGIAFLSNPRWKVMRRVFGIYGEDLPALAARGKPLAWTSIGPRYPVAGTWSAVSDLCQNLVELDLAQLWDDRTIGEALRSSVAARMRRVRVATRRLHAGELVRVAQDAGIAELELVPDYTFPGSPEGVAIRIAGTHLTVVHHDARASRYPALVVAQLAAGSIRSASIVAVPGAKLDAALATALDAHGVTIEQSA